MTEDVSKREAWADPHPEIAAAHAETPPSSKFKVGDLAMLKSGGPQVTIDQVDWHCGEWLYEFVWFNGCDLKRDALSEVMLKAPGAPATG